MFVGLVSAVVTALWAFGSRVVMPLIRVLAKRVLRHELSVLEANSKSLERMWPEQLQQSEKLQQIMENQEELRDMVMRLDGREGGRRRYDPK